MPTGFVPLIHGSQPHHLVFKHISNVSSMHQISCYCGAILGELEPTDGPEPAIALMAAHRADLGAAQ